VHRIITSIDGGIVSYIPSSTSATWCLFKAHKQPLLVLDVLSGMKNLAWDQKVYRSHPFFLVAVKTLILVIFKLTESIFLSAPRIINDANRRCHREFLIIQQPSGDVMGRYWWAQDQMKLGRAVISHGLAIKIYFPTLIQLITTLTIAISNWYRTSYMVLTNPSTPLSFSKNNIRTKYAG